MIIFSIRLDNSEHQGTDSIMIQKCGPNATYIQLQGWESNDLAVWKNK